MTGAFSPDEFDAWAESYAASVSIDQLPSYGYQRVLANIVALAEVRPAVSVLDLGTGTVNLPAGFARAGCEL